MIDMTNTTIDTIRVLRASQSFARHASWWCLCLICGREFAERGDNLRRAMAGKWVVVCPGCGG